LNNNKLSKEKALRSVADYSGTKIIYAINNKMKTNIYNIKSKIDNHRLTVIIPKNYI